MKIRPHRKPRRWVRRILLLLGGTLVVVMILVLVVLWRLSQGPVSLQALIPGIEN